ncbi:kinase-like domain-containing protein [Trichoderma chlorosporum]
MEDPSDGEVLHSVFDHRLIKRFGENKVRKSGPMLRPYEAETMKFIAEKTTIPVPKVYDTDWQDGNMTAILMEYIPGKTLDKVWDDLDKEQKMSIALELKGYMEQLGKLKGEYIGALNRGKALIGKKSPHECGPFETERAFNRYILEDIATTTPEMVRLYARYSLWNHHEINFTHGDFAPRNIIIDENYKVAAILDWEESGWYPEHWEYIKAFAHLQPMEDWPDYLMHIFPPKYEREYIGMCFLDGIMYH